MAMAVRGVNDNANPSSFLFFFVFLYSLSLLPVLPAWHFPAIILVLEPAFLGYYPEPQQHHISQIIMSRIDDVQQ